MAYRQTQRVRRHLQSVRERLLQTAREMVAESGFSGLQVARLAEKAGVATGTIYRHFPNKGALCAEVFSVSSQREVDVLAEALAGPGSAVDRLDSGLTLWCERAQQGRVLARALLTEPVDPAVEQARLRYRAAHAEVIAAVLREGIASGELPEQDPDLSAACLVGALAEAVLGPLEEPHEAGATPSIIRFCLAAIRPGVSS